MSRLLFLVHMNPKKIPRTPKHSVSPIPNSSNLTASQAPANRSQTAKKQTRRHDKTSTGKGAGTHTSSIHPLSRLPPTAPSAAHLLGNLERVVHALPRPQELIPRHRPARHEHRCQGVHRDVKVQHRPRLRVKSSTSRYVDAPTNVPQGVC